jgi:hypothetical protein
MTELVTGFVLLSLFAYYVGDQIGQRVNAKILSRVGIKATPIALVPQPTQRQFTSRRADTIVIVRIVPDSGFGG